MKGYKLLKKRWQLIKRNRFERNKSKIFVIQRSLLEGMGHKEFMANDIIREEWAGWVMI